MKNVVSKTHHKATFTMGLIARLSLISLMVCVDIKHHIYLLIWPHCRDRQTDRQTERLHASTLRKLLLALGISAAERLNNASPRFE